MSFEQINQNTEEPSTEEIVPTERSKELLAIGVKLQHNDIDIREAKKHILNAQRSLGIHEGAGKTDKYLGRILGTKQDEERLVMEQQKLARLEQENVLLAKRLEEIHGDKPIDIAKFDA